MKKTFITLTSLLFTLTSFSQTIECKKFKNGTFYYPTIQNKISVRKDSIQESYNNGKLESIWKVNWINECEYELICQQVLVDPYPIIENDRILVTIVQTEGDCFTTELVFFEAGNPNGEKIPSGPMCIKKE